MMFIRGLRQGILIAYRYTSKDSNKSKEKIIQNQENQTEYESILVYYANLKPFPF